MKTALGSGQAAHAAPRVPYPRGQLLRARAAITPREAFTLIELMIAVCIIGVLASVAIPAFSRFIVEAKSSEVYPVIGTFYRRLSSYWDTPAARRELGASEAQRCVITGDLLAGGGLADMYQPPFPPGPEKRRPTHLNLGFAALGFDTEALYYCSYTVQIPATCTIDVDGAFPPDCGCLDGLVYEPMAICDLDGDGLIGGVKMQVGARNGALYRAPGYSNALDPAMYPWAVAGID